jgi:hypothetical protein
MPFSLLVERWGASYLSFVPELPGCQFEETDLDALVEAALQVVAAHPDWLCRHGLSAPACGTIEVRVSELREALPGVEARASRLTAWLQARRPSTRRSR